MKSLRVITVGKLKTPHWQAAAAHYQKRLSHSLDCEFVAVKDGEAKLAPVQRMEAEAALILRQIKPSETLICLDETGNTFSSVAFSQFLQKIWDTGGQPVFVVGGAFGTAPVVKTTARHLLALGPMTLPHELAQVVLLEQLYRAESIQQGSRYHHE